MALHALQAPSPFGRDAALAWPNEPSPVDLSADRVASRGRILARDDGRRVLLVLAEDRGPGDLASRALAGLASALEHRSVEYLVDLLGLFEALPGLVPILESGPAQTRAALVALAYDRHRGCGFGACLGDGACFLLRGADDRQPRRLNPRNRRLLVSTVRDGCASLRIERPDPFSFQAIAGQVLVATASDLLPRRRTAVPAVHELAAQAWREAGPPDREGRSNAQASATRLLQGTNLTVAASRT